MKLNRTVLMVNWRLWQYNNLFPLICWIRLDSVLSVLPVSDASVGKNTVVTPQLFTAAVLMHVSPWGQRDVRNKHGSPFNFELSVGPFPSSQPPLSCLSLHCF